MRNILPYIKLSSIIRQGFIELIGEEYLPQRERFEHRCRVMSISFLAKPSNKHYGLLPLICFFFYCASFLPLQLALEWIFLESLLIGILSFTQRSKRNPQITWTKR